MASELEIPTLSNSKEDEDDYHNAITGTGNYSTHQDSNDVNGNGNSKDDANLSEPNVKSGIFGASSNLVNSIVGAGIIGIPYAFKQSGLIAGIALLILVAFLTDKSLRIIVGLASFHPLLHKRQVRTFEDLAAYPFGKPGRNFILLNMFVLAYGAMIAYLLIIKDTIPSVLGIPKEDSYLARNGIMLGTSALIMLPLAIQRDMASLAITSLFSIFADVLLVVFIASFAPVQATLQDNGGFATVLANDAFNPTLFIGLGILSTAMACQHSAFIVSESLDGKTARRWAIVTGNSIAISAVLCLILGTTGYLGFLEDTASDVLNSFDHELPVAKVARVLLAITMFFTYPMESFVARHVLVMLFHNGDMDGRDDPGYPEGVPGAEAGGLFCLNRRQTWTIAIYIITLIPALLVDDIGPVLSITGSLGGGSISYLAPGAIYLGVNGDAFLSYAYSLLQHKPAVTEADLPIDGNRTVAEGAAAGNLQLPVSGNRVVSTVVPEDHLSRKPIWWYLAGFPIWCAIASTGRANMRRKMMEEDRKTQNAGRTDEFVNSAYHEHSTPTACQPGVSEREVEGEVDFILPNVKDYCTAVFFMIFGTVAIFAGLTSNIWMIIQGTEQGAESENANEYYGYGYS